MFPAYWWWGGAADEGGRPPAYGGATADEAMQGTACTHIPADWCPADWGGGG